MRTYQQTAEAELTQAGGRIEIIIGPMFSGKTTELIDRFHAAEREGQAVIAIKPAADDRYHAIHLVSHDRGCITAHPVEDESEIEPAAQAASFVAIDEAHFFSAGVADTCCRLRELGKCVVSAGVDLDHRGRLFPAIAALRDCADRVTVRTARCARCGAVAQFTQRLVDSDAPIVVGGAGQYEPRCAACFQPHGGADR